MLMSDNEAWKQFLDEYTNMSLYMQAYVAWSKLICDYGLISLPAHSFTKTNLLHSTRTYRRLDCCFKPNLNVTKLQYYSRAVGLISDINNVNNTEASA